MDVQFIINLILKIIFKFVNMEKVFKAERGLNYEKMVLSSH